MAGRRRPVRRRRSAVVARVNLSYACRGSARGSTTRCRPGTSKGDDALYHGQPAVEKALEEVALPRERVRERERVAGDHLQLDRGREIAHEDVVIVVSAG